MKKISIFLLTIIISLVITTNVKAADNVILKSTKDKVNLGEEITISLDLNVENIISLYAYTAKLSYDKDVFEIIEKDNFEESENWSDITYNTKNNKFALINKEGDTKTNSLQIKLKVREDATPGKTIIAVNSITASDGEKDIKLDSESVEVMILKDGLAENESIPINTENEVTEENTIIEVEKDYSWIAYILIALMIIIFIFVIYYYIKSEQEETPTNKRITIISTSIIILIILLIFIIIILADKKADVNKDNQVDYEDTKDIIEYLLEIKNPNEDENISDKDINKDGQITIGDVAKSVNQATNQSYKNSSSNIKNSNKTTSSSEQTNPNEPVTPSEPTTPNEPTSPSEPANPSEPTTPSEPIKATIISSMPTNYYVEKGKNVEITYTIEDNTNEDVKQIRINGVAIAVTKVSDGVYKISAPIDGTIPQNRKVKLEVTEIIYTTEVVSTIHTTEVEILKLVPTITDDYITHKEDKSILHFNLVDEDDTFISGKVVVIAEDGTKTEKEFTHNGNNSIEIEISDFIKYNIKIEVTYDLDTNKNDNVNKKENEIIKEHEVLLEKNYNLQVTDFKLVSVTEDIVTLQFTSTNETQNKYYIENVIINNKEYTVIREGNTYIVNVPTEDFGKERSRLILQEVIINYIGFDKEIYFNDIEDILVFKTHPTATIDGIIVGENQNTISVNNIKIIDNDNTINKKYAVLKYGENIVSKKEITENAVTFNTENIENIYKAGKYTIEIAADYDAVDGKEHIVETIGTSEEFTIAICAQIESSELNTYPKKNENMTIKYKIKDNTDEQVTAIYINGEKRDATKVEENVYSVSYTAPETSGPASITASKICYGTEEIVVTNKVDNIDVLKTKPYLLNKQEDDFEIYEDFANKTITVVFTIVDPDNASIEKEGYVTLAAGHFTDTSGNNMPKYNIGEKTTITFKDVTNGSYMLQIYTPPYDLDSNPNDDKNHYIDVSNGSRTAMRIVEFMQDPSQFHVDNITAKTDLKGTTKYLNKNEKYKLSFTADAINTSDQYYYPQYIRIKGDSNISERTFELERNGKTYITKEYLDGYDNIGPTEVEIESIILNNNEVISLTDKKLQIEVLKEKLDISDFVVNMDSQAEKATITYNMTDTDNSFISGKIVITDTENEEEQKIITIEKGKTSYDVKLTPFKNYTAELFITYDLDGDNTLGSENQKEEIFATANIELKVDYELSISDLQVVNIDKEKSVATLTFKSTNVSKHKISFVKVEGQEELCGVGYNKETDTYTFEYKINSEKLATKERTEIKIKQVKLDNNDELDIAQEIAAIIFKNKPTIENLKLEVIDNIKITAAFDVKDTDNTLNYLYVGLKNSAGNEVIEDTLEPTDRDVTFDITEPDKYTIVVKGSFNLIDGEEHNKDVLKESDEVAEIQVNAKILESILQNKYPNKNETIEIQYKIMSNTNFKPTKVTINDNKEYELIPTGKPDIYKISYQVSDVPGQVDLKVSKIYFENEQFVTLETPYIDSIDVLKSVPIVNITSEDFVEKGLVMFNIDVTDPDGAMTSGKAFVHENEGVKTLESGPNTLIVNVEPDTSHTLTIEIEYDLDSNTIQETENKNKSTISEKRIFTLTSNYNLEINNLHAINPTTGEDIKYVNKGEQIQLRFNSVNSTELTPKKVFLNDMQNEESDGTLYDVYPVENSKNEYYVNLTAENKAGNQKFEIESVILSSGKTINKEQFKDNKNPIVDLVILKTKPTISGYTSSNVGNSVIVTFNITDNDKALNNSKIKLINEITNVEITSKDITEGTNNHTFDALEPGVKYIIRLENSYRLSDDGKNDNTEIFKDDHIEITKKEESNFKARNLKVTERVPINKKAQVSFENGVMSYQDVDKITIDDVEYSVEKDDKGVYKLELEPKEKGVNTIQVQNAKIGEKTFPINRPLSYTYEFAIPEAKEVTEIEEEAGKAIIKYKLEDPDKSIRGLTAYMKNSSGSVATQINVEKYSIENGVENIVEMSLLKLNTYSIELRATCDIGNGTTEEKTLFEKDKISPPQVTVIKNEIDKEYVEKGGKVVLTFVINTNVDSDVKKIYINQDGYNVEKVLDEDKKVIPDTYTVTLEAPKEAGVFEQNVTSIKIGDSQIDADYDKDLEKNKVCIKVLKDVPTLTHFIVNEQEGKITFKVNDEDKALSKSINSKLIVKQEDREVGTAELNKGGTEYDLDLEKIGMTAKSYPQPYNVVVNSTYDLRPDAPENMNIFQKIKNFFTGNKNEVKTIANGDTTENEDGEEEPEEPKEGIRVSDIFNKNIELTGNISYNLDFEDKGRYYLFNMKTPVEVEFDCSTGTRYKVEKVILEGKEYPVVITKELGDNKYTYQAMYIPSSYSQESIQYNKIILENGKAFDINETIPCMIVQAEPTFSITNFTEDTKERKVRFGYKLVDDDKKLADSPTFTLKDSQGSILQTIKAKDGENMVEFDIPDPPTSIYNLSVTVPKYVVSGWDYTEIWEAYNDSHKSSVTTSILSSEIQNKYPKKGETIEIIYNISSTRVVLIDKEDHTNQDKAVSITKMIINGKEYDVETLDEKDYGKEKYRVYYTAKDDDGIEEINVSKILFSNGDEEEFPRKDKIDILKETPQIVDFKTENNIETGKVTFKFKVLDPDSVLGTNSIYAQVDENGETQPVNIGENTLTFDAKLNQLSKFKVKATYDLDSDQLTTETDDNSYEMNTIFEKPFILTEEYAINFSNIKKYNSKGEETEYFEKNEDIKLTYECTTNWQEIYPELIVINGENYTPQKVDNEPNTYFVKLKSANNAGKADITFDRILLNSGNEVSLTGQKTTYEVLKDIVAVDEFTYTIGDNNDKIQLQINIKDIDSSNKNLTLEIKDEYDHPININKSTLNVGKNIIEFDKTSAGKYFASIYSTYDRDMDENNSKNNATNERIHYSIITVNTRYIEMKDIVDIELYKYGKTGEAERVDSITPESLNPIENCLVKVIMKDIPEFYSNITKYSIEDNKLKLVLEYTDAMVFNGNAELKPLEVTLELSSNGTAEYQYDKSFNSLIDEMKANPEGTFNLTKDYDLAGYAANNDDSTSIIDFEFKGILNGNGHRIYNLGKPLFNTLKDATIENIIIDKPEPKILSNTAILAKLVEGTTIKNVHIMNPICNFTGHAGIIAFDVKNKSVIESCSVTNIVGNYNGYAQLTSGFVTNLYDSTIKNCYLQGKIGGGWHFNAAFVKSADKYSEISNNIVNVTYTPSWDNNYGGNGGLTYTPDGALLKNNLCLIESGKASIIHYNGSLNKDSKNNYQLEESTAPKNENEKGIETISKKDITSEFFKNILEFSSEIWNIPNDASISNLPTLKSVSESYSDNGVQPENSKVYIPDYNRVTKLAEYKKNKEITYHNMYKIMPFYDAKELINDGNKIPDGNILNTKLIKYIVPYNKDGKMVTYLTTENYNSLGKIKMVFEDGTTQEHHIDFDDYYGNVASYMISDLKIGYNYNRYVIDTKLKIVQELIEEASKYEFTRDLEPLTTKIEDSRLYKEHFEKVTKNHIPEFVVNSLVNLGYTPAFESDVLDNKIRQELIDTNKLKQLLFAYNYFTYWYNLDMQGINLADAVMFQANQMFDDRMNLENMSSNLINESNSATNGTAGFYNNYLASLTKCSNLGLFLDYYVTTLTDYKDGNEWFKDNFKGGIYETVDIERNGTDYTIWDHVKKDGKVQNDILPALTVPENSMFIISAPTQVCFGSLRVYVNNPNDEKQIEQFRENKLKLYLDQIKSFYVFGYDFWGADTLNKYCDVQYDMRTTYTGRREETVYNNPLTTEENYHKYFIEAINRWAGTSGGAYANGSEVFWNVIKMLDGGFRVSTHETLHNQDSKIFMNNYGRRGGAEDYAAGFLQQYYRDGWVSPNIFDEEPNKENTTQNLHRSTVNTNDKLTKFYRNYFRTNDFLDYIEAQAFFKLSDEEKAKLVTQVSYPKKSDAEQDEGDSTVAYQPLTLDTVKAMKLDSIEKLWDNRIMLRPKNKEYEVHSPGADTDSIFNIHWYQPHADNDRPDGANFKYLAWQMAGEKGYYDGLTAYYSLSYVGQKTQRPGLKTTDLIALQYITGDNTMTYKRFKIERYNELAEYYNRQDTYIDAQQICKEYYNALQADAKNNDRNLTLSTAVKRKYFSLLRSETQDFTIDPFSQKTNAAVYKTENIVNNLNGNESESVIENQAETIE